MATTLSVLHITKSTTNFINQKKKRAEDNGRGQEGMNEGTSHATVNAKQLEKFVWLSEDNPTKMIH